MSERSIPTSQPVFAILIPVYNHKESLPLLLEQLQRLATQQDTPLFKIVVVDDGSHPPVEIPKLSGDEITLIRHPLNYGKGAALLT
ncbi:MAG: glycosyltransferase, partial [Methanobacteriota archaeon]